MSNRARVIVGVCWVVGRVAVEATLLTIIFLIFCLFVHDFCNSSIASDLCILNSAGANVCI